MNSVDANEDDDLSRRIEVSNTKLDLAVRGTDAYPKIGGKEILNLERFLVEDLPAVEEDDENTRHKAKYCCKWLSGRLIGVIWRRAVVN